MRNKTTVCFINTEQKPVKIIRMGFFRYTQIQISDKKHISELCEVFYPHPDAPDWAFVSILSFLECEFPNGIADTVNLTMRGMRGFQSVTTLKYNQELVCKKGK